MKYWFFSIQQYIWCLQLHEFFKKYMDGLWKKFFRHSPVQTFLKELVELGGSYVYVATMGLKTKSCLFCYETCPCPVSRRVEILSKKKELCTIFEKCNFSFQKKKIEN